MSSSNSMEVNKVLKELDTHPHHGLSVNGEQRGSLFSLFFKRFLKILQIIFIIAVLGYAMVQTWVSESILVYFQAIGILKN